MSIFSLSPPADNVWLFALLILLAGLLIGGLVGAAIGRRGDSTKRKRLTELQAEYDAYRQKVEGHFSRSAELFDQVTGSYRALYQHMAESEQTLLEPANEPGARLGFTANPRLAESGENADKNEPSVDPATPTDEKSASPRQ